MWSSNGFDGATYEFKTNCFDPYDVLEACPLWEMTRVAVESPNGQVHTLEKDFNVNDYSGEVTRRWVLYGPPGAGLPTPGVYTFRYYQGAEVALEQTVDYRPDTVGYPTGVAWRREGTDMVVTWTPPSGMSEGMWYKVLVFPDEGELISQVFAWDAAQASLLAVPLADGDGFTLNVAAYFAAGYAYSDYQHFTW